MLVRVEVTTRDGKSHSTVVEGEWHRGLGEGSFIRESIAPGLKALGLTDEETSAVQATSLAQFSDLTVEEQSDLRRKRIDFLEGVIVRMEEGTVTEDDQALIRNLRSRAATAPEE